MSDALTPEDLARLTAQTLANYDNGAEGFWAATRDHDVTQNYEALLTALKGAPPYSILDLGCGPGRDLAHFKSLGHEAIGIDGSKRFVEMARAHSGCEVWHQDFNRLSLPSARFDGVFANATLQHVPKQELERVLKELRLSLKADGVLFSSIPRGNDEEKVHNERLSAFHSFEKWMAFMRAAGFTELTHYYRPKDKPLEEQPWLASVWRR